MAQALEHNTGILIGKDGIEIFYQNWLVKKPKCILIILHGLGEHSGRYEHIVKSLAINTVSYYTLDHRGHGKSAGKRGHINNIDEYISDLKLLIRYIENQHGSIPRIIMGHSMGGVIATKYVLTYPNEINALILSSPAFVPVLKIPKWKEIIGKTFSKYMPGLTIPSGIQVEDLMQDATMMQKALADPLFHQKVSTRLYTELYSTADFCLNNAHRLSLPLLLFHGTSDKIVDYQATVSVYESATSKIKEIKLFEGLYHETMNEAPAERKKVFGLIEKWIRKQLKSMDKKK